MERETPCQRRDRIMGTHTLIWSLPGRFKRRSVAERHQPESKEFISEPIGPSISRFPDTAVYYHLV